LIEIAPLTERDRGEFEARKLLTAGRALNAAGKYDEAIQTSTQGLEVAEKSLPADDPLIAVLLGALAMQHRTKGELADAEAMFERAVDIDRKAFGEESPVTARAIGNLGLVHLSKGEFTAALPFFDHAVEISERTLGPDDPQVALYLMDVGVVHSRMGDQQTAVETLERALKISEKWIGPEDDLTLRLTYDLGDTYLDMSRLDLAKPLMERSLAIIVKTHGTDHPYNAYPLQNLGIIARKEKNYDQALEYLTRAEKIREKSIGLNNSLTATLIVNIGNVYHDKGDYAKATEYLLQALDILEKTTGPNDPNTLMTLANLARTYSAQNDSARAFEYQARMDQMIERNLTLNLATGSEREKLAYIDTIARYNERSIWMGVAGAPDNPLATEGAAAAILQRKGRVLDALAESMATLRVHLKPEDQALLDELASTTSELANLSLSGPKKTPLPEYQSQLDALQKKREKLEADISRRSEGYFEPESAVTLSAVRQAVPRDAALIEYATYQPYYPKQVDDDGMFGEPRYVAFVIPRGGKIGWADLGPAAEIDRDIAQWRSSLADPTRKDTSALGRTVDQKVMAPVRAIAGNANHLLISPEGELNLVPFEALVDENQQFLVERYSITYLTTGRDLLRMQNPRASRSAPMVLANPFFGEPSGTLRAQARNPQEAAKSSAQQRRNVTTGSTLAEMYFAPLPGTEQEARSIQGLFPNAVVVTGRDASKSALRQANAPQLLHIATHGFFLEDPETPEPGKSGTRSAAATQKKATEDNPLLHSGLALSGANATKDGNENGVLTGLEAAGLNLWGTKLVTLSACETGIGTVKDGEGVYGLRRAFFLAGTETLVMSLWDVSDRVTREMMGTYYAGLKSGMGRGEALRQAQLAMLKRTDRQQPYYWASFIQAGEWANLDGKR
jgi:CHAT domain-containing protein/tetratricopeptide (TPR) repeat protein